MASGVFQTGAWAQRVDKRLMLHDIAILVAGSALAGVIVGALFVPYAQPMFIASGFGLLVGGGVSFGLYTIREKTRSRGSHGWRGR